MLVAHLGMSVEELMPLLTKTGTRFVYIKKKVPALTYSALATDLSSRRLHGISERAIRSVPIQTDLSVPPSSGLSAQMVRPGRAGAHLQRAVGRGGRQGDLRERAQRQQDPARQGSITPARNG